MDFASRDLIWFKSKNKRVKNYRDDYPQQRGRTHQQRGRTRQYPTESHATFFHCHGRYHQLYSRGHLCSKWARNRNYTNSIFIHMKRGKMSIYRIIAIASLKLKSTTSWHIPCNWTSLHIYSANTIRNLWRCISCPSDVASHALQPWDFKSHGRPEQPPEICPWVGAVHSVRVPRPSHDG